ncbi:silent information regulator family protein, partial [Naegleria gruberi]
AGIPDFRTPGTGLYDNLQKYNLPHPTAIFELKYLPTNPHPFFHLSRDFISSGYKPTKAHYFIKLLEEKNKLKRLYTQNIDGLEAKSGITKEHLVNCHGMYDIGHCIECSKEYSLSEIVKKMGTDEEVQIPKCDKCGHIVKPDIVLFGESLPNKYVDCCKSDLLRSKDCEVFIVIGTSLSVYPVAGLPEYAPEGSTRALLNREKCGPFSKVKGNVAEVGDDSDYLDLFLGGEDSSIDECVEKLCKLLGWEAELEELYVKGPVDLVELSKK